MDRGSQKKRIPRSDGKSRLLMISRSSGQEGDLARSTLELSFITVWQPDQGGFSDLPIWSPDDRKNPPYIMGFLQSVGGHSWASQ